MTQTIRSTIVNAMGAVGAGLFLAFIGLNAASGCGQGGQCIQVRDFIPSPAALQIAEMPRDAG